MDALAPYVGRVCGPIALQDGPDAAQEALIAILKKLGGLREPAAIYGWARMIAVREAVRVARQAARAVPAELADVPAPEDPQLAADVGSPSSAACACPACACSTRCSARPSSPSRCAPSAISSTGSRPADQPAPAVGNVTG